MKKRAFIGVRGAIFDLDGTILNTQTPFHATAECRVLSENHGIVIEPDEISAKFAGIPTKQVFKQLAPECDPEDLTRKKWQIIEHLVSVTDMQKLDMLGELCVKLSEMGIPIAVASASPRWYIEMVLQKLFFNNRTLFSYFDFVISAEEVLHPKPHPDVFLCAAEGIGLGPSRCIVVGDGESDVLGGLSAGMNIVFLSENPKFDTNPHVQRFTASADVHKYILELF